MVLTRLKSQLHSDGKPNGDLTADIELSQLELMDQISVLSEALAASIKSESDCLAQLNTLKAQQPSVDLQYMRNTLFKLFLTDNPKVILPYVMDVFGFSKEDKAKIMARATKKTSLF
ncbi:hypothetical protein Pelo_19103 [Pelomyxa schiedti]|nr:hypothetical protein Pelo_19103 [Pelomyxa schiedti]